MLSISRRASLEKGITPFSTSVGSAILGSMRHKTGNGHSVNLEKFLDDIKVVVEDGERLLKAGAGEIKEKAIAGAQSTDRVIRRHPYQTLGVIFGVGLLVGLVATGFFSGTEEEPVEEDKD